MTTCKTGLTGRTRAVTIFVTKSAMPAIGRRLAAMAAAALAVGLTLGVVSATVAGAATTGTSFGRAFALDPPVNAAGSPSAFTYQLACSSFGNCATGGSYTDRAHHNDAMVITETSGRWNRGVELRLPKDSPANVNADVWGISCPRAGACVAVGAYPSATTHLYDGRVFAATETGGRWQPARELRLPANAASPPTGILNAVSCTAIGSCLALGDYVDSDGDIQAMLVREKNGRWNQATEILPVSNAAANPAADFRALTCQPDGQCVIAGVYRDITGHTDVLGIIESHGSYLAVANIPLPRNADHSIVEAQSVSCQGSGKCVIVGSYRLGNGQFQAMSAVESGGDFHHFAQVTATAADAFFLAAVSCTATGQCVAVGTYTDPANHYFPYELMRSATGHWSRPAILRTPPGAATAASRALGLAGVSCFRRGCTAAGYYTTKAGALYPMAAIQP